jgi:YD repeat-containing protein
MVKPKGYTQLIRDATYPTKVVAERQYDGGPSGTQLAETTYENIDPTTGNVRQIRVKNGTASDTLTQIEYAPEYQYAFPTRTTTTVRDADGVASIIEEQYTYDPTNGLLTGYTDGRGQTTAYQYDMLGRVTQALSPDNHMFRVT